MCVNIKQRSVFVNVAFAIGFLLLAGCGGSALTEVPQEKQQAVQAAIAEKPLDPKLQKVIDQLEQLGAKIWMEKQKDRTVPVFLDCRNTKTRISDEQLNELSNLNTLEIIHLAGTSTPKSDLIFLPSLQNLESLSLYEIEISNEGMANISGLTKLWYLGFGSCTISEKGLLRLNDLPALRYLTLTKSELTPQQLKHVAEVAPNLQSLNVIGATVGDEELEQIAKLSRLEGLYLDKTNITNNGLRNVLKLKKLKKLSLSETKITDDGLRILKTIPALESLLIYDCDISMSAIRELEQANPSMNLLYYQK